MYIHFSSIDFPYSSYTNIFRVGIVLIIFLNINIKLLETVLNVFFFKGVTHDVEGAL